MVSPIAAKLIPVATGTTVAISYKKISDGSNYVPAVGDGLVVILGGTKSTTGVPSIPSQTGWQFGSGPTAEPNGGVSVVGAMLFRIAGGNSTDLPTFSGLTSTPWQAETYAFAAGTFDPSIFPWDPATPPQTPSVSIASAANAGVAFATRAANELVLSAIVIRGPAGTSALAWGGGSTVDQAVVGSSNNFLSTAMQTVATTPNSVTPSASWTGGSGTASVLMSVGIAPPGSVVSSTQRRTRASGAAASATRSARAAGAATLAARKIRVAGVAT